MHHTHTCIFVCIIKCINTICSVCLYACLQVYLILDNLLVWSSLDNTFSPTLSIPWLSVVLCLLLSCLAYAKAVRWDFMGVASSITRRHNLTENSFILWLLQSFCFLFQNNPKALDVGVILYICQLGLIFTAGLYLLHGFLNEGWGLHLSVSMRTDI